MSSESNKMTTIKWNLDHQGVLEMTTGGGTHWGGLLDLGAVYHDTGIHGIPTDADGKRVIRQQAHDALRGIYDAAESIGWLMAYCDIKEIPEHQLSMVGWTLAGLGRLGQDIMNVAEMAAAEEAAP